MPPGRSCEQVGHPLLTLCTLLSLPLVVICCRFRQLSAEVLCSDAWAITETTLSNPDEFLRPFWDSILGAHPTADPTSLPGQLASAASPRPNEDGPSDPTGRRTSSETSTTEVDLNDHHDETETPASDAESISGEDVKLDESEPVKPEDSSDEWLPAGAKGEDESEDELDHAGEATKDGSKEDDGLGELDQVDNEREVVYGQWSRVNSHLLGKKTAEVRAPFLRACRVARCADQVEPYGRLADAGLHSIATGHRGASTGHDHVSCSGGSAHSHHPVRRQPGRSRCPFREPSLLNARLESQSYPVSSC